MNVNALIFHIIVLSGFKCFPSLHVYSIYYISEFVKLKECKHKSPDTLINI